MKTYVFTLPQYFKLIPIRAWWIDSGLEKMERIEHFTNAQLYANIKEEHQAAAKCCELQVLMFVMSI